MSLARRCTGTRRSWARLTRAARRRPPAARAALHRPAGHRQGACSRSAWRRASPAPRRRRRARAASVPAAGRSLAGTHPDLLAIGAPDRRRQGDAQEGDRHRPGARAEALRAAARRRRAAQDGDRRRRRPPVDRRAERAAEDARGAARPGAASSWSPPAPARCCRPSARAASASLFRPLSRRRGRARCWPRPGCAADEAAALAGRCRRQPGPRAGAARHRGTTPIAASCERLLADLDAGSIWFGPRNEQGPRQQRSRRRRRGSTACSPLCRDDAAAARRTPAIATRSIAPCGAPRRSRRGAAARCAGAIPIARC